MKKILSMISLVASLSLIAASCNTQSTQDSKTNNGAIQQSNKTDDVMTKNSSDKMEPDALKDDSMKNDSMQKQEDKTMNADNSMRQ